MFAIIVLIVIVIGITFFVVSSKLTDDIARINREIDMERNNRDE